MADEILLIFETLIGLICFETVLLLMLMFKTPAVKFLKASLRKRMILIHPKENHYVDFETSKSQSNLAYVKNRGYYSIYPEDVYIEGVSKVPTAIVYGNLGMSLDMKMADFAERLKQLGIRNGEEFLKLKDRLIKLKKSLVINIAGESVDASEAANYFNTSQKSDLIEAEIQRRTAAQLLQKMGSQKDIMKWAMFFVLVLIGGGIAYAIVSNVTAPSAVGGQNIISQAAARIMPTATTVPAGQGIGVQ